MKRPSASNHNAPQRTINIRTTAFELSVAKLPEKGFVDLLMPNVHPKFNVENNIKNVRLGYRYHNHHIKNT